MKKIIIAVILIFILLLATGCDISNNYKKNNVNETGRFRVFKPEHYIGDTEVSIIVDTETNVQYISCHQYYGTGLTILVDEEGRPLLYEGEINE